MKADLPTVNLNLNLTPGLRWSLAALLLLPIARPAPAQEAKPGANPVTYDQVRPVFRKHCTTCHNQDQARGELDLSTIEGIKAGAASGPAVIEGRPEESLIYTLAAHQETPKMPPNSPKIPQRELDLLRRWIEGGLAGAGEAAGPAGAPKTAPAFPAAGGRMPEGKVQLNPLAKAAPITALAVSPAAPIAAISGRKQVVLFQLNDRQPLRAFPFPEGEVFALRFSRDGEWLLAGGGVGGQSGKVVGFEVSTGKRLFELADEPDVVLALDLSPDRSHVALGGPSRSVKVFRTADGQQVATLRKHTEWILSLAYSPDGLLLASGDRFGALQVWEAQSGNEFHTLRSHVGPIQFVGWAGNSEQLISAGQDGALRVWNMHDGTLVSRWDAEIGGILAVAHAPDGQIYCGGRNGKIAAWQNPDSKSRELSMADEVVKLALGHDGSRLVAGDATGNVSVFSLIDGTIAGSFALPIAPATTRPRAIARSLPRPTVIEAAPDVAPPNELAGAETGARRLAEGLIELQEASTLADSAVQSAEQSLVKLRETAAKLASATTRHKASAEAAARRVAELRAEAGPADRRSQRAALQKRLAEKRELLQSTSAVAQQIARASEQSPQDSGLASAAGLAAALRDALARDVDSAVAELARLEAPVGTAQN